ncbi:hypothetical protein BJX63DRAFT_424301 [Aspergillus granulosus]|uniref:Uncharacterized protein n=1 Tax=Aspergillus granulosus TaxID=176169 RepID=A0ABR4H084_9EURO
MDPIESSSSPFAAQSTKLSASLQRNSMETITTEAEQRNPDPSNTINIQSGGSLDTRTKKPLLPTPNQTPRRSDQSAADTLLVIFQSDSSHSEAFTSDRSNSPKTTPRLGLLNLASDLLPVITETGPPTISSKTPHIPSVLTAVDDILSEIDMDTVRPLDLIMTLESDRLLVTGWNALSAMDTLPLGFAPTTTAAPLVETLPAPEKYIDVFIPTGWSSPNQEGSLDQAATAAPTQAVDVLSRNWQRASVTRTPAKPLITPLFSNYNQVVYNGGSLSTITKEESVLIASSTPSVLNQGDGGRLPPPSSTPSPRSRNLSKTKEICDSGSSRTTPARPIEKNKTTSTSIYMVPEKPAVPTHAPTVPHGPEWRPSTTTTLDTATSSVDTDSILDQLQRAQSISRQSMGVATGTVSAGIAVFILTFVLHHFVYRWVSRQRAGVIQIRREPNTNTGLRIELPHRSQNPEVSYFSDSS